MPLFTANASSRAVSRDASVVVEDLLGGLQTYSILLFLLPTPQDLFKIYRLVDEARGDTDAILDEVLVSFNARSRRTVRC